MIVERNKFNKSIILLQIQYITRIFMIFNLYNFKFVSIFFEVSLRLTKDMNSIDHKNIETIKDILYSFAYQGHKSQRTKRSIYSCVTTKDYMFI